MRLAVIGAGLSGLAAANALMRAGHEVVIFEKSRGLGGRLATRRLDGGGLANHGIPAIDTAPGSGLADTLAAIDCRTVLSAGEPIPQLPLGQPVVPALGVTMAAKRLGEGLTVVRSTRIARLRPSGDGYELGDEQGNGHGWFAGVVVSAPSPQAADLLEGIPAERQRVERLRAVAYDPAIMLIGHVDTADVAAALRTGAGPVLRVATLPLAGERATVVAHLDPAASGQLLDAASDAEITAAAPAMWDASGFESPCPEWAMVKRWRYATVRDDEARDDLVDVGTGIVLSGDGVCARGLPAVWQSGLDAARRLIDRSG